MDRTKTNEYVFKTASELAQKEIIPINAYLQGRNIALLGHLIRTNEEDPMRRVTFRDDGVRILEAGARSVGGPRAKWPEETVQDTWRTHRANSGFQHEEYNSDKFEYREAVQIAAQARTF